MSRSRTAAGARRPCRALRGLRPHYNSCRNRHCPKCQGAAARTGLAEREAELLPVPYYHLVFTLPAAVADIAYQNKATVYDILFKASSETLITIAADPKHSGARVGAISVLHTWGSALTHHPHIHMIAPGGGVSLDGLQCRLPAWLLSARAGSLATVPSSLPRKAHSRLRCRPAAVFRRPRRPRGARCIHGVSHAVAHDRMGRLRQATLRRTRGSAGLSGSLHASRRHLQSPADRAP
jgi:hypothetical protein